MSGTSPKNAADTTGAKPAVIPIGTAPLDLAETKSSSPLGAARGLLKERSHPLRAPGHGQRGSPPQDNPQANESREQIPLIQLLTFPSPSAFPGPKT